MSAHRNRQASENRRIIRAAVVGALLIAAAVYVAFVRQTPFSSRYEVRAVFATGNQLRPGNPVRVSGVDIGEVTSVQPGPGRTTAVTMALNEPDQVGRTPTLSIKPRLLFEGNFYIDVSPRGPGPQIARGAVVPVTRTHIPVQLDEVVNTLDSPTRDAVASGIDEVATGLGGSRASSGAAGARTWFRELDTSLADLRRVAQAARGTRTGDLRRAVQGGGAVAGQLASDPRALADGVSDLRRVAQALSERHEPLRDTVREFATLARTAPADLRTIDSALPSVDRFSDALRPTLRSAPMSLHATTALLREVDRLTVGRRLPALLRATAPLSRTLDTRLRQLRQVFGYVDPVVSCLSSNVVPALNKVVPDGPLTSGDPAWQELLHLGASLAGSSPSFDGNGTTIRLGVTNGSHSVRQQFAGVGEVISSAEAQGVSPSWLGYGAVPPSRPDAKCAEQALPNLGLRRSGPPAGERIRRTDRNRPIDAAMRRLVLGGLEGGARDSLIRRILALAGLRPKRAAVKPDHASPVLTPTPQRIPRPAGTPARPKPAVPRPPLDAVTKPIDDVVDAVDDIVGRLPKIGGGR